MIYLVPKEDKVVVCANSVSIQLKQSNKYKLIQSPACSAGEYALMKQTDENSVQFKGYISYQNVCEWFELVL